MTADFGTAGVAELVVVSAGDDYELASEASRIVAFLDRVPDASLVDVAYTCSLSHGPAVLALVVSSVHELRERLVSARDRIYGGVSRIRDKSGTYYFREHLLGEGRGRLAYVYPGAMSYYPDMLRDVAIVYPECRSAFDELEEALSDDPDFTPSSFIFPPASYYRHDADIFSSGAYAQSFVASCAGCIALTRLMDKLGAVPDGVVGCVGGDLAAAMKSGATGTGNPRPMRVRAIREIYAMVDKAVDHAGLPKTSMISVHVKNGDEVDAALAGFPPDKVSLAVDFSPRQRTYAVSPDCEAEFLSALDSAGVHATKLALERPFNTAKCKSIVAGVKKFAGSWLKHEPVCDVYSCAQAARLSRKARHARNDTAERWAQPVRFRETIRAMYDDGYRVFLEVGPRGLMTVAVGETLRGEDFAAIALNSIHRRGMLQLRHAVGQLAAYGATLDISHMFERRRARKLDFDSAISPEVRRDAEMRLSSAFPRLTLLGDDAFLGGASLMAEPKGRGARAAQRAAAVAAQARRQRQFDFGAVNPLVSDADIIQQQHGVMVEITKTFRVTDAPFLADFALGNSQLSYSDPNLRGLVTLSIPVAAEIMAEVARMVMPNGALVAVEDLNTRRMVTFASGELKLYVKAERVAASDPKNAAVKVQIRDDSPNAAYTWAVAEGVFVMADETPPAFPVSASKMFKPRTVHWSDRDIYPSRICFGRRLRGIRFVDSWSESGLDYEVEVPALSGAVVFTRFPLWVVNPLLLGVIASGFSLWRSHERFTGAFSFPFRMRRLEFHGQLPAEGSRLKCYLRLTGVTPKSHLCDITVTDGNGTAIMTVSGWEELTERVPAEYRELVLQPATSFLTNTLSKATLGEPATEVSSAWISEVPYPIFERNGELWLKTLSHVILGAQERDEFMKMPGSTSRRTEWLFGRVAAKEAVRRYMNDYHHARWSDADIQIWRDDSGKPHALGAWGDYLTEKIDIAIAHTAQFVVALAAANARVGVDVESAERDLSDEFTAGVFTEDELEIAAGAPNASQAVIRFWCAKEAVSKALGTGIRWSPREMHVTGYHPESGKLAVRLEGGWLGAFKKFRGRDIEVVSRVLRGHALAFCFIPAALFDEE
jgi:phosphopantetheinyl transferase (holo-ACP synthase)/malonyl CoA-acyl carrier protein transacylase